MCQLLPPTSNRQLATAVHFVMIDISYRSFLQDFVGSIRSRCVNTPWFLWLVGCPSLEAEWVSHVAIHSARQCQLSPEVNREVFIAKSSLGVPGCVWDLIGRMRRYERQRERPSQYVKQRDDPTRCSKHHEFRQGSRHRKWRFRRTASVAGERAIIRPAGGRSARWHHEPWRGSPAAEPSAEAAVGNLPNRRRGSGRR